MTHTCHDCHTAIPTGLAVLRSIGFERVAFHGHCWDLRQAVSAIVEPAPIPVQRRGTLSERLAAARVAS